MPHRHFDRAGLQHLCSETGQFKHLFESDLVQFAGFVTNPRIGGVDPIDISINITTLGVECRSKADRRCVRTTPPQSGNSALIADALKPGHHRDLHAFSKFCVYIISANIFDPCRRMVRRRLQRHLPTMPAARRDVHFLQPKRH